MSGWKPGFSGDLGDIPVRFHEEPLGVHDAGLLDILHDRALGTFLEFPAEVIFADIKTLGEVFECDILLRKGYGYTESLW